jgi:hypothetical protein
MGKSRIVWFSLFLLYFGLVALPAQAYIDPGSGSFIFQVVVGGLLGAAFAIKTFWRRIVGVFRREPKSKVGSGPKQVG